MDSSSLEARLLFRSDTIQRLASPRYADLCPTHSTITVGNRLTPAATEYRQQVMRYDYMKHPGREFDDIAGAWNRLLAQKPAIRPFRMRIQRGTGKPPKIIPVYGIAPTVKIPAVVTRLQELAVKGYPTLQPHYFDSYIRGNNPREDVIGWFDIVNSFCWFVDEDMMRGTLRMLGLEATWGYHLDNLPWETTFVIPSNKPQKQHETNTTDSNHIDHLVHGGPDHPPVDPDGLQHGTTPGAPILPDVQPAGHV